MSKVIGELETTSNTAFLSFSLHSVSTLRLVSALVILLGSIITTLGISWDIQWHSFVGRDRTLIPPHEMMLGGILLSGVVALTVVLIETRWARRNILPAEYSTGFTGIFHSSLGAYIAGFGALDAAIGFPLDACWHALYGIDVSIWAPFHVMILSGAAMMPLGAAYMLISVARLATEQGQYGRARTCYLGAIAAFATLLSMATYLLVD